jgi:hypothetical protein
MVFTYKLPSGNNLTPTQLKDEFISRFTEAPSGLRNKYLVAINVTASTQYVYFASTTDGVEGAMYLSLWAHRRSGNPDSPVMQAFIAGVCDDQGCSEVIITPIVVTPIEAGTRLLSALTN